MKNILKNIAIGLLLVGMVFGNTPLFVSAPNIADARTSATASSGGGRSEVLPVLQQKASVGSTNASADLAVFNNHPDDKPTLRTANVTRFGAGCTTCWGPTAPVKDGELVSFNVFYHNNSNVTALNTRINLEFNNHYPSQQVNVTGKLWADNANPVYGQASLLVEEDPTQPWHLEFQYAKFYPNSDPVDPDPLPNGQNGSTITDPNGVNIGNITGGLVNLNQSRGFLVTVFKFVAEQNQGGAPVVSTKPATSITGTSAVLNGQVNANGSNTNYWFEYGTSANSLTSVTPTQSLGSGTAQVSAGISGLASDTTYFFRVSATNANGSNSGDILNFKTAAIPVGGSPIVTTYDATDITHAQATLQGHVNPNEYSATYWFEYGKTSSGLTSLTPSQSIGLDARQVSSVITGLTPDTTYYFRVAAKNVKGTSYGMVRSFTTNQAGGGNGSAPDAVTKAATAISYTHARLNGTVNPNGLSTTYTFQYGTVPSLTNAQSLPQASAGSGTTAIAVSAPISGLTQNTTYYFRIIAKNAKGTDQGEILSFKTLHELTGGSPIVQTHDATIIKSSSAKLNGNVNPNQYSTNYWFEYGTTPVGLTSLTPSQNIGTTQQQVSSSITGLSPATKYYFRVAAKNEKGTTYGMVLSFTTLDIGIGTGDAPLVETLDASNITQNAARFNGRVNPRGLSTTYTFQYGTSETLTTYESTPGASAGSGKSFVSVSAPISGLTKNTTYYFRITARNAAGTAKGEIQKFTTLGTGGGTPIVATRPADGITHAVARLHGEVDANGFSTNYWFEYGKTATQLTSFTPSQNIGTGAGDVNALITGLNPNTKYFFRIAARNSAGTSYGSVLSFTTKDIGIGDGELPVVETRDATDITKSSARLQGGVNPKGLSTTYGFHYGISPTLATYDTTAEASAGSGNAMLDVSMAISELKAGTTYYFRVVAKNSKGSAQGTIFSFTTSQISDDDDDDDGGNGGGGSSRRITVTTDNASVITDRNATLYGSVRSRSANATVWFEYGTAKENLSSKSAEKSVEESNSFVGFSIDVAGLQPNSVYYYRAVGESRNQKDEGVIRQFSTFRVGARVPAVQTLLATYISQNASLLNGTVNPNGYATRVWFEYGRTAELGSKTFEQPVGAGTSVSQFSHAVSGLQPNTVYFFRAVAQNQYGRVHGIIYVLRTRGTGTAPAPGGAPPVVITDSFGTGISCALLVPTLDNNQFSAGQEFVYTITYKNDCDFDLTNAYLKVILPTEVEYDSSNYPESEMSQNNITYSLGTVPQGTEAAITINAKVANSAKKGDVLIFSSVLNFEDNLKRPQSISAYLTADVLSSRTLTATILDVFRNLFGSWWFSLLLLLAVLFLIFWIFFRRKTEDEAEQAEVDVLRT